MKSVHSLVATPRRRQHQTLPRQCGRAMSCCAAQTYVQHSPLCNAQGANWAQLGPAQSKLASEFASEQQHISAQQTASLMKKRVLITEHC